MAAKKKTRRSRKRRSVPVDLRPGEQFQPDLVSVDAQAIGAVQDFRRKLDRIAQEALLNEIRRQIHDVRDLEHVPTRAESAGPQLPNITTPLHKAVRTILREAGTPMASRDIRAELGGARHRQRGVEQKRLQRALLDLRRHGLVDLDGRRWFAR